MSDIPIVENEVNKKVSAQPVIMFDDDGNVVSNLVTAKDSSDNITINDVIGNKNDNAFSGLQETPSIIGHLVAEYLHVHSPSIVYPRDAASVTVTAGVGAYTEGSKVEVIASSEIDEAFDIHYAYISLISEVDEYVIKLYSGEIGSEEFWGEAAFSRDTNQNRVAPIRIQGPPIPAGTRVSASLLSGAGSNTSNVKLYTHEYPQT